MRPRAKDLLSHVYENGTRVEVTSSGVTIWDGRLGRWIIDASCIAEDNNFSIGKELYERAKTTYANPVLPAFYRKRKTRKPKKLRSSRGSGK